MTHQNQQIPETIIADIKINKSNCNKTNRYFRRNMKHEMHLVITD